MSTDQARYVLGLSGLDRAVDYKARLMVSEDPRSLRFVQGFDSAAVILRDGVVVAAVQEERLCRRKATGAFPRRSIDFCLGVAGITLDRVDLVAHSFAYNLHRDLLIKGGPRSRGWFENVFNPELLKNDLRSLAGGEEAARRVVSVPHHLAHAASSFYPSGFDEALVVVADGMGEVESCSIFHGSEGKLERIDTISAAHSLGTLYGLVTHFLGFSMAGGEGKVMGMAPLGDPTSYVDRFRSLVVLRSQGRFSIPFLAANESDLEVETFSQSLAHLWDLLGPPRRPGEELQQRHFDIAAALQKTLEETFLHLLSCHSQRSSSRRLCLAGGVALNCCLNAAIGRSRLFSDIFVQPAASDEGSALGAALSACGDLGIRKFDALDMPLWGPEFSNDEVETELCGHPGISYKQFTSEDELLAEAARCIMQGNVLGWFQGRLEFGPRALGSRSILASPTFPWMKDHLNDRIKQREGFRPFAPVVPAEEAPSFFDIEPHDCHRYKHMLFTAQVRLDYRGRLPAITHADGSARVQAVHRENRRLWNLLKVLGEKGAYPILVNTSFNVDEEPIVSSPREAIADLLSTAIDVLFVQDFMVVRSSSTSDSSQAQGV